MCYYSLYLFLACGHCIPSYRRLGRSPPCPARSHTLFHEPNLASPIGASSVAAPMSTAPGPDGETIVLYRGGDEDEGNLETREAECVEKMSHPLHTYRIAGLCLRCVRERDERLASFEVGSIRDAVEHEGVPSASQRPRRKNHEMESLKVKLASPGLRSGYVEGRGRGMILERNAEGGLVDRSGSGGGDREATGWNPEMGAFEGRKSGSWRRESSATE